MTDQPQNALTPAVNAAANPPAVKSAGGLSYQTATKEELVVMDGVIETIIKALKEGNAEGIIEVGGPQRKKLADLSDQMLQNINPQVNLAFKQALSQLLGALQANSIVEIKKRLQGGAIAQLGHAIGHMLHHKPSAEDQQKMVQNFMKEIDSSRKSITETADRLVLQETQLNENYGRINTMGKELTVTAQDTRVVRAATAEAIRRIEAGDITVLADIEAKAKASGRADDLEALQIAQANWNNLRTVDGALLSAINVFDTQVANLAFTKNLNIQNRMQTENALSITVPQWKSLLVTSALMWQEEDAGALLNVVDEMSVQAVKQQGEEFTKLTNIAVERAGSGVALMRQLITTESDMATTLQGLGARFDEKYREQTEAKTALEIANQKFKETTVLAFSKPGGVMGATIPKPAPGPA
ncbi:MAG TPA: hypothetical protein VL625_01135 [Patescibacteria group bacterium]|nr:hypothetical protein [Patescibacteria group bacterium]